MNTIVVKQKNKSLLELLRSDGTAFGYTCRLRCLLFAVIIDCKMMSFDFCSAYLEGIQQLKRAVLTERK